MTQLHTHSADSEGAEPVGQAVTYAPAEQTGPGGPIERVMSTVIRKLSWSKLSNPAVAVSISGDEFDAEAEKLYGAYANYFYNRCLHIYPGFLDAPGYRTIKTIKMGALSQYSPDPKWATLSWKDLIDDAFG